MEVAEGDRAAIQPPQTARSRRRRQSRTGRRRRQVIVRFSEAEHVAVAQRAAAARLALGAWLGELAVSGGSEHRLPVSWREFVHELVLLRIELVAARSGGLATRTEAFPSSTIGDSGPDPLTAIDGVLDRLDQMIGSAGLRAVRPRP